ncbi:MAG: hypothetical protein WCO00_10020 [Rhodospirillaceae bacterium]
MFVVAAQSMVIIFCLCGLLMFLYVHLFSTRRIKRLAVELRRGDVRQDGGDPGLAGEALPRLAAPTLRDLIYLQQEQVRRITDAKIEIIRSAANTENQMLLMHARAACDGRGAPGPQTIEMRALRGPAAVADGCATVLVVTEAGDDDEARAVQGRVPQLRDYLQASRAQTRHHLAEVDQHFGSWPAVEVAI